MTEPVTLDEVKQHLRFDPIVAGADGDSSGASDEDAYLELLIVAARRAVERRTARTLVGDAPTLAGDDRAMAIQAMLLLIGTWYANREGATADARSTPLEVPLTVTWLLEPLVAWDDGL